MHRIKQLLFRDLSLAVKQFLNPAEYFENSADVLQDFVVSLSKEKADHLRYKLDGEEVKVLITPYRSRITQDDLTFSYGNYNLGFC